MPRSEALLATAAGVLPNLSPMTRVGVFPRASSRSCVTCAGVHGFPELRLYFAITISLAFIYSGSLTHIYC
jgi:hypothetical protein